MKNTITKILIGLSALLILFALNESIGRLIELQLVRTRPDLFDPDSFHVHYANHAGIMYVHIIAGMIFIVTGVHQIIPALRKRNIARHRLVGKMFLSISFVVSISAIIIGVFFPYGNWIESLSNLIFGVYILYSTIKAYTSIRTNKVLEHSNWVRRVFFISLSIATIRLVMILNMVMTGETVQEVMGRSFLIGFSIHVIILEWWIRSNSSIETAQT